MLGDFDIRLVFGVALAAVLVGQVVLRYLPYGRRLYAIGSNPDAARTAGLPMQRDVFWAFTLCGAMSGLAGFLYLARFGNITVVAGQGLELAVIAAVVVGGVNIFGGSGSMIGALLGVILIEVLQQSLLRWLASASSSATSCSACSSSWPWPATRSSSGGPGRVGARPPARRCCRSRGARAGDRGDRWLVAPGWRGCAPGTGSCSCSSWS